MDFVRPVEALIPGVQGRVLGVLVEATAELSLRSVARLAGVSAAQASRVMVRLVELGVVERREVPPASLFRLCRDHVGGRVVVELARARESVFEVMGVAAGGLVVRPVSVIVFGSFVRREADERSDIDVVFVRGDEVGEDSEVWVSGVESWRELVGGVAGNVVEVVEVGQAEVGRKLVEGRGLWGDVARDGVVVFGVSLDELKVAGDV